MFIIPSDIFLTSQSLGWVHTISGTTAKLQHFPFIFNECKMQTSAVTDDRLNFLVATLINAVTADQVFWQPNTNVNTANHGQTAQRFSYRTGFGCERTGRVKLLFRPVKNKVCIISPKTKWKGWPDGPLPCLKPAPQATGKQRAGGLHLITLSCQCPYGCAKGSALVRLNMDWLLWETALRETEESWEEGRMTDRVR